MILKLPENRKKIIEYLNSINEDTFIEEIVIPLFNSQGYQVYRINTHGPGEHGKDIIFVRYVPLYSENEFVCVQAKAEKVTTTNVEKCSGQIIRALKVKFPSRTGGGEHIAHYAVFINARTHSNDAHTEFPQLVDSQHAKILSQENVCEIIMQYGIAPEHLLEQLSIESSSAESPQDKHVYEVLLQGTPAEADALLDHELKFLQNELSQKTKELVVEYIRDRWEKDRSWLGTVKPMKWFDSYFEFFSQNNSKYLLDIMEELISSTPSYEALAHTKSVVSKIKADDLIPIESDFIFLCGRIAISHSKENTEVLIDKLQIFAEPGFIQDESCIELANKILMLGKFRRDKDRDNSMKLRDEIYDIVYPEG